MNVQNVSFGSDSFTLQVANSVKNSNNGSNNVVNFQNPETNVKENTDTFNNTQTEVVKEEKKEKKKKKSLFEKIANFVGSMKKAGVNIVEYTKGGAKGTFSFARDSVATVGAIFLIDKIRQGAKLSKETGKNVVVESMSRIAQGVAKNFTKEGIKATLKSGKGKAAIVAGVLVGALGFARQIYKAKLNANERNAMIDHRYVNTPVISK